MALTLIQVFARSAFRLRAVYNGGSPAAIVPTDITIARQDGGPCTVTVGSLQLIDGQALEVRLSERLLMRVIYVLKWTSATVPFSFILPANLDPSVQAPGDDPDAEVNGVDWAWLSGAPTPDGDMPRRSGLACVEYDLPNRAEMAPNELVQFPTAGANLKGRVNSSVSDSELLRAGALLEAEFRRDDRVQDVEVDTSSTSDGVVKFQGQVQTRSGQSTPVRST